MSGMKRAAFSLLVFVTLAALAPAASAVNPGTAAITGTVTNASSQPVEGALVTVCDKSSTTDCLPGTSTDASGAYSLNGVPDDFSVVLQVTGPNDGGLLPFRDSFPVIPEQSVYNATLAPGAVDGYVRGPGNAPVAGAEVNLLPLGPSGSASAVSGPSGYFVVGDTSYLADGLYNLSANKLGLFPGPTAPVNVATGTTAHHDVTLVAGGAVQGTVTSASTGLPIANAVIQSTNSFGALAVTDANGHYLTPVVRPDAYTIRISPPLGTSLVPFQGPVTISSGVTSTLDVTLALGATVTVYVLRADGTPYPAPGPFAALCTTPTTNVPCNGLKTAFPDASGKAVFTLVPPGAWDAASVVTVSPLLFSNLVSINVTGGDSFSCTFLGLTGSCGGANDADGVSDAIETGAPNGGDGNNDGTLDAAQANVTSLPSSGPGAPYVTLEGPVGTSLVAVTAIDPALLPTPPGGATLPFGVLGFRVPVSPGAAIDVNLYLASGSTPNQYLKFQNGSWLDFSLPTQTTFAGNVVTLHLVDGGPGDADGLANGSILDPGAPAIMNPFAGFASPIKNPPAANSAKAGSTVPIKFSLGGNKGMNIFAAGFPKSQPCGTTTATSIDSPGSSSLSYDARTGLYSINWKTQKAWAGTCRDLVVQFANGGTGTAKFNFK